MKIISDFVKIMSEIIEFMSEIIEIMSEIIFHKSDGALKFLNKCQSFNQPAEQISAFF